MAFQLSEYHEDLRNAMGANGWTAANTVKRFITNMASLRPMYPANEWSQIAFNQIGQQWNRLGYAERNKQQAEAVEAISIPTRRARRRRIEEEENVE